MKKENSLNNEKKKNALLKILLFSAITALVLSLILCLLLNDAFSLSAEDGYVTVTFKENADIKEAAKVLKENGLIKSRTWFIAYAKIRGRTVSPLSGSYEISKSAGFDGIIARLSGSPLRT